MIRDGKSEKARHAGDTHLHMHAHARKQALAAHAATCAGTSRCRRRRRLCCWPRISSSSLSSLSPLSCSLLSSLISHLLSLFTRSSLALADPTDGSARSDHEVKVGEGAVTQITHSLSVSFRSLFTHSFYLRWTPRLPRPSSQP